MYTALGNNLDAIFIIFFFVLFCVLNIIVRRAPFQILLISKNIEETYSPLHHVFQVILIVVLMTVYKSYFL